jgi:hypothetical protein
MLSDLWNSVLVLLCLVAGNLLIPFLPWSKIHVKDTSEEVLLSTLAVTLVAVIIYLTLTYFTRSSGWLRRRLHYPYAHCEDLWCQTVAISERPYTVSRIAFSKKERVWKYYGIAFDKAFRESGEFSTTSRDYDKAKGIWVFSGHGRLHDPDGNAGPDGYTVPMLSLEHDHEPGSHLFGRVADIALGERQAEHGRVFTIHLTRAGEAYKKVRKKHKLRSRLPTLSEMKDLAADQLTELFQELHML